MSSSNTPDTSWDSQAYERIAVLSHNAAGPSGGMRFAPELAMLERR
jgi:hypothetical protein